MIYWNWITTIKVYSDYVVTMVDDFRTCESKNAKNALVNSHQHSPVAPPEFKAQEYGVALDVDRTTELHLHQGTDTR